MAFEISFMCNIKANREFVFDWWTDLSPEDTRLVKALKKREIVSKSLTLIELKDEEVMYFKRMKFEVKVFLERPKKWVAEYCGRSAHARSEYVLTQKEDGTTNLFYHTKIEPAGILTRVFSWIVRPFVKRVFLNEMKIFARALEADYETRK